MKLNKPVFKSNVKTTVLDDAEPNSVYYDHY